MFHYSVLTKGTSVHCAEHPFEGNLNEDWSTRNPEWTWAEISRFLFKRPDSLFSCCAGTAPRKREPRVKKSTVVHSPPLPSFHVVRDKYTSLASFPMFLDLQYKKTGLVWSGIPGALTAGIKYILRASFPFPYSRKMLWQAINGNE